MEDTNVFVTSEELDGLTLTKYTGSKEHVEIPNGIVVIGQRAFAECEGIKSVTIPSSVKIIYDRAFLGLESLEEVTFSEGLETILHFAFDKCTSLKEVRLPNSLKNLGASAFYDCKSLVRFEFGKKLKALDGIFSNCDSLQELVIPKTIQKVNTFTFSGITGLKSIRIESDLSKSKKVHFISCPNLTDITFSEEFTNLKGVHVVACPKAEYVTVGDKKYPILVKKNVGTLVLEEDKPKISASNEPVDFAFNEKTEQFECDFKGIFFAVDHEPDENDKNNVRLLAENYAVRFDKIVKFMLPDLKEIYGKVTAKDAKAKLGKPTINLSRYTVSYMEQSFDGDHIFEFEFMDDEFDELENFTIDG